MVLGGAFMYDNTVTLVTYDEKTKSIIKNELNKVYLERKTGLTLSESGENTASNAVLYVPFNKGCFSEKYYTPKKYDALNLEDKANAITFKKGQLVILGKSVEGKNMNDIENLNDNVFRVLDVSTYDSVLPHVEITCK